MTRRKGGIGRHVGAKRSSRMKNSKYNYKLSKDANNSKVTDNFIAPNIDLLQDKSDCTDVVDSVGWKESRGIASRDVKIKQLLWENTALNNQTKALEVKVKTSVSKVNSAKSTMNDVVAWSRKKVERLLNEKRMIVTKERTAYNSEVKDLKNKFRSQIIHERQDSAAKINGIEAKCKSVITNAKSKRVNLVKHHMTKIEIERGKNKKALEKVKLMSRKRLREEQSRSQRHIQLIEKNSAHKISAVENKSQASIDYERKKRADIVKAVKDKSAKLLSRNLVTTESKLAKSKDECKKMELKLIGLIDQEKQKGLEKINKIDTQCLNTVLKERKMRVDALIHSKNKLKRVRHIINDQKETCRILKYDAKLGSVALNKEKKQRTRIECLADTRLVKMKIAQNKYTYVHDKYLEMKSLASKTTDTTEFDLNRTKQLHLKKERTTGRHGGGSKWPLPVVQLVIEQLVNGTPPTSIRCNIASFVALSMTSDKVKQLPSLSFIRECRVAIQIIGETLTAYRLANAPKWEQVFTDGTSRRQISLQNLVIGLLDDNVLKPLILSSSIIPEDETSENQVNAIMLKVRNILHYQYYNIKTCILTNLFYNPKTNPNNTKQKLKS